MAGRPPDNRRTHRAVNDFSDGGWLRGGVSLLGAALASLILACGPGDYGAITVDNGGGAGAGTGGFSLFITDAPNPDFDSIWLTVTSAELLGPDGPVVLFEGETIFDLLRLRSVSELFSIRRGVPSGVYTKIRLQLADVELVWHDANGNLQTDHPQLSGNGKLDLEPRGSFRVDGGQMLVVQIDIDGQNAIHIHQTGNGRFQFRPVVFVDVIDVSTEDRLARVHGVIDALDPADRTITLCELNSPIVPYWSDATASTVVPSSGKETATKKDKDKKKKEKKAKEKKDKKDRNEPATLAETGMPDVDDCIELVVLPDADLIDEASGAIDFDDLRVGDSVLAVGHLRTSGETLQILTRLLVRSRPGGLVMFDGAVTSPPDSSGEFEVEARMADFDRVERIDVQLTPDTQILNRAGAEVGRDWLFTGQRVEVIGSPVSWTGNAKRQVDADVVWVGDPPPGPGPGPGTPAEVSGDVTSVDAAAGEFTVLTGAGTACVAVDGSTRIDLYRCTINGCVGQSVDFSAVAPGQQVVAAGTVSGSGCLLADDIVLFENTP